MTDDEGAITNRKEKWELSEEAFESLLQWLNTDRDQAGSRYEEIRQRLIRIFGSRGCAEPEGLADEAINRVAKKVVELAKNYEGDPALYFYGVANKIHLEQLKRQKSVVSMSTVPGVDDFEKEYICLDRCMDRLPPDNRDLVMKYYDNEKNANIAQRRLLAEQLGIGLNALRLRAHRIRLFLHECITGCLEEQTQR